MSMSRPQQQPAQPAPPPPPSRPHTVKVFCPHLQIDAVGVLRASGQYYYYCYDYTEKKFAPLPCLGCQLETTERHLYPRYAEYCKELDAHVCFAFNSLSCKVEQFVFRQSTGGFEEVHRPEMVYDTRRPSADILCVVKETKEYGMVIIQNAAHGFKKSRAYNGQYLGLPPVRVKTLMVQRLDDLPMTPIETEEFRQPYPNPNNDFTFVLQHCHRYPKTLVCIRQEDDSLLRFSFSEQTGDFLPITCPECTGPVIEFHFRPLYAAHSKALGEHVIFMENIQNLRIEQYVFCKSRGGLNQVEDKDLVYDQRLIERGPVILKVETEKGPIEIQNTESGFMAKMMLEEDKGLQKLPSTDVRTLAIQKKEEEEEQRKKREQVSVPPPMPIASDQLQHLQRLLKQQLTYVIEQQKKENDMSQMAKALLARLQQQQQPIPANVTAPVTVTPESESDDSEIDDESDSDESDSGSESGTEVAADSNDGSFGNIESEAGENSEDDEEGSFAYHFKKIQALLEDVELF